MSKTPKLRFKEFSGDWEIHSLGDRAYIKGRIGWKNLKQEEYTECGPYLIAGKHINNGIISWNKCDHISIERYNESPEIALKNNDIIFSKDGSLGNPAIIENLKSEATINGTMMLVRVDNNIIYPKYFYYILNSSYFKKLVNELKSGSSIPHIFQRDIVSFKFPITEIEEQEKIASFFSLIDDKISLQSDKVEALKDYKKGIMQKIFSRELRFKDDDGSDYPEWEEKKLGELGIFLSGGSLSKNDLSKSGVKCILYGDLFTEYTEVINDIRNYTNKKEKLVYGEYNTLLFPTSTTVDAISLICPSALMIKEKVILGGDMSVFKPMIDNVICSFLSYQINGYLKHEFSKKAQGSTIIHIYGSDLQTCRVLLPCIKEQLKITQLLYSLDKKIEKEQEKLDYLNEYKKGLLQQMFV